MLFSLSLAKKLGNKNLVSVSLHPGVIWTNLGRDVKNDEFVEISKLTLSGPCQIPVSSSD